MQVNDGDRCVLSHRNSGCRMVVVVGRDGVIIQPSSNIIDDPIQTRDQVLPRDRTAWPDSPIVRFYGIKVKSLQNKV